MTVSSPTVLRPHTGPLRKLHSAALLVAAAVFSMAFGIAQPARAGWWDEATEARESTLDQLRSDPQKWRDVPVLLRVTFSERGKRTNPYFTQFAPERWRPITVTAPSGAAVSRRRHDSPLRTLFVQRGGAADLRLQPLRPGRSVLLRAVVRDVVGGEPWLEVLSVTVAGDPLTPEERTRVRSADRFLARANPGAAEKIYRGVLDGRSLADADRATLLRKLGVTLHDQRRGDAALAAFRSALALDPDHLNTRTQVAAIEKQLARTPLIPMHVPANVPAEGERRADVPPTAARAAPTTPKPDTPLYLPGGRPTLAPPGGGSPSGESPSGESPSGESPRGESAERALPRPESGTDKPGARPTTRPSTKRPARGNSPEPKTSTDAEPTTDPRLPPPLPRTKKQTLHHGESEPETDTPPPPPAPPLPSGARLSGPK